MKALGSLLVFLVAFWGLAQGFTIVTVDDLNRALADPKTFVNANSEKDLTPSRK
jgi:hypothetical protein